MNFRNVGILSLICAMMLSVSAFAQFGNKTEAFEAPGPGDPNKTYAFVVPEGVTIELRDGRTVTGGEKLSVPGKYIELLAVETAEEKREAGSAFNNQLVNWEDKARGGGLVMILLTIPEGVTISVAGGESVQGETQIELIAEASAWEASEEMAEEPTAFNKK